MDGPSELVFVLCPIKLAGKVENSTQLDVGQGFDSRRLQIPIQRLPEFVRRSLVVLLLEVDLGDPVMCQRTGWVDLKRHSVFFQRNTDARVALSEPQRHG